MPFNAYGVVALGVGFASFAMARPAPLPSTLSTVYVTEASNIPAAVKPAPVNDGSFLEEIAEAIINTTVPVNETDDWRVLRRQADDKAIEPAQPVDPIKLAAEIAANTSITTNETQALLDLLENHPELFLPSDNGVYRRQAEDKADEDDHLEQIAKVMAKVMANTTFPTGKSPTHHRQWPAENECDVNPNTLMVYEALNITSPCDPPISRREVPSNATGPADFAFQVELAKEIGLLTVQADLKIQEKKAQILSLHRFASKAHKINANMTEAEQNKVLEDAARVAFDDAQKATDEYHAKNEKIQDELEQLKGPLEMPGGIMNPPPRPEIEEDLKRANETSEAKDSDSDRIHELEEEVRTLQEEKSAELVKQHKFEAAREEDMKTERLVAEKEEERLREKDQAARTDSNSDQNESDSSATKKTLQRRYNSRCLIRFWEPCLDDYWKGFDGYTDDPPPEGTETEEERKAREGDEEIKAAQEEVQRKAEEEIGESVDHDEADYENKKAKEAQEQEEEEDGEEGGEKAGEKGDDEDGKKDGEEGGEDGEDADENEEQGQKIARRSQVKKWFKWYVNCQMGRKDCDESESWPF